jgi:hypothetical protein
MLSVTFYFSYAERHYAECHYAECRGAQGCYSQNF